MDKIFKIGLLVLVLCFILFYTMQCKDGQYTCNAGNDISNGRYTCSMVQGGANGAGVYTVITIFDTSKGISYTTTTSLTNLLNFAIEQKQPLVFSPIK